jgi:Protein of unknown function (DUF2934)
LPSTPDKKGRTTTKGKAAPNETAKPRTRRRRAPTHDAIAQRAYELYLKQGGGDHVSHWLQAERELSGS